MYDAPLLDLAGILGLLDDPDITEVVIASGQPVTVRKQGGYKAADPATLSVDDILDIATGTPFAPLLSRADGDSATVQLFGRAFRAEVNRFGERVMIRLLRGPRTMAMPVVTARAPARDEPRREPPKAESMKLAVSKTDPTKFGVSKAEPAKFDVSKVAGPKFDQPKGDPLPRAPVDAKPALKLDLEPDRGPPGLDVALDLEPPPPPEPKPIDDKPPIIRFRATPPAGVPIQRPPGAPDPRFEPPSAEIRAQSQPPPGAESQPPGPQFRRADSQPGARAESQPGVPADGQPVPHADPQPGHANPQFRRADSQPIARADSQPVPHVDPPQGHAGPQVRRADSQPIARADSQPVPHADPQQGHAGPQVRRADSQPIARADSQPVPHADPQQGHAGPQFRRADSQPIARADSQPIARADSQPAVRAPSQPLSLFDAQPPTDARHARITLPPAMPRKTTIMPPIGGAPLPPLKPPAEVPVFPEFVALVDEARRRKATDLHVVVGQPAMLRVGDGVVPSGAVLSADDVDALLLPLLSTTQRGQLDQRGYVDAAIDLGAIARLRMNLSRTRAGLKGSFRVVMTTPPTLEQLGLPPELARVTTYHQGLVLIAGPNGHGKTTTLGALVDLINRSKAHHILTVEDPVEILHRRKKAVISQREVGTHTKSFASALKASLREDPDVIVIGELRDRESVEIALTAAETGHLVMATTSTPSAAKTIDRLIDNFPPADQPQVRASLAAALRFVVAQRLLPGVDGGLVAAVELVTGVLPLANMIRDDKLFQLGSLLQRGRAFGMIRLDDSLAELARAGKITEQVALRFADNKRDLEQKLKGRA